MKSMMILMLIGAMVIAGCSEKAQDDNTQIANPASANCIEKGGKLDMLEAETGTIGMCTLPSGAVCEEWAFFRGECPCGECPVLSPPGPEFCRGGQIMPGAVDDCGCQQPPRCEQTFCTADAKICDDGSAVGRTGPDCEFAPCPSSAEKTFCTQNDKQADFCTREFHPVCGWFGANVQCIRFPCAITESNPCEACKNPDVEYWTEGECPA